MMLLDSTFYDCCHYCNLLPAGHTWSFYQDIVVKTRQHLLSSPKTKSKEKKEIWYQNISEQAIQRKHLLTYHSIDSYPWHSSLFYQKRRRSNSVEWSKHWRILKQEKKQKDQVRSTIKRVRERPSIETTSIDWLWRQRLAISVFWTQKKGGKADPSQNKRTTRARLPPKHTNTYTLVSNKRELN